MKTADLIDQALDWAVAKALGQVVRIQGKGKKYLVYGRDITEGSATFSPSKRWDVGGPIIERESMQIYPSASWGWCASKSDGIGQHFGPTPLIAAMRCYVASKLGPEVEIPEELS